MIPPPPTSTLFPYTTLFRSVVPVPTGATTGNVIVTVGGVASNGVTFNVVVAGPNITRDRKSTRLNSSHSSISYAVFCLKKKKKDRRKLLQRDTDIILERKL